MGELNTKFKEKKKIAEKNTGNVYSLLLLKDGRLATTSSHKDIKVYNLKTYNIDNILKGHTDIVTSVCQLENNYLVSSSYDCTLCIWRQNKTYFVVDEIFTAHTDKIHKVIALSNQRIASCSEDKTIKIWKGQKPYEIIQTLRQFNQPVESIIQIKGKEELLSGSYYGKSLKIWSLISFECITDIDQMYSFDRNSIFESPSRILLIGCDNKIAILKSTNYKLIKIIQDEDFGFISSICELDEDNYLIGCEDGKLYVINVKTLKHTLVKRRAHEEDIICMSNIGNNTIISGSYDKSIKIWSIIKEEEKPKKEKISIWDNIKNIKFIKDLRNKDRDNKSEQEINKEKEPDKDPK